MTNKLLLLVFVLLFPVQLLSQGRWQVGPHILVSIPRQEFENAPQVGGGFGVKGLYELSDNFTLRGDFAYLSYGKTFENIGFDPVIGPIVAELQNQGFRVTVGPQGRLSGDAFALYGSVQGGLYYFRTNVTIPIYYDTIFDSRNNNFALGWNGGVGIQFDIGLGPWIDIGAEYQTMYNLPGPAIPGSSPEDPPTPGPDITARELTLKFGVVFFLGEN